tara:strand:- start:2884 stop:3282 length:399 start_codon:yes stop_codon:yes gene_type:complete
MHIVNGSYYMTDDPQKVDVAAVKLLLSLSYWAPTRSVDVIKKTIENSICFSVYKDEHQIAFARVVSDFTTFAYIADVIVDTKEKGNGIGKWLMDVITKDERWNGMLLMLATDDAHGLYEKYGFKISHKLMST